jgi:predicted aspartyl protease
MGIFHVDCEFVNVRKPAKTVAMLKLLIDTGSEFSWLPETALKKVGVNPAKRDVPFQMANGQTISRATGYVILRVGGFETVDEFVFGLAGDLSLLGARTLKGFGAIVDPRRKRLVAVGPHPAAPTPNHPEPRKT